MSSPLFHDRRDHVITARLAQYDVKVKSVGGGSHEVHVDGRHVDTIHPALADGVRGYASEKSGYPNVPLGDKAQAVRDVVARHDARSQGITMTAAHWHHIAPSDGFGDALHDSLRKQTYPPLRPVK